MRHHVERIRRIQALCAELDHTIQDSHAVQRTVEHLKAESEHLLNDLNSDLNPSARQPGKSADVRGRAK